MKQYIWIAAIIAVVGANASENPFDLNKNLKKIDQAEKSLLSDLESIAQTQETKASPEKDSAAADKEKSVQAAEIPKKAETVEKPETQRVVIETAPEKEARLKKLKEEQARLEAERAAKKAAAKRAAEEKAKQEKMAAEKAALEAKEIARIKKAQAEKAAAEEQAKRDAEKMEMEKRLVDGEREKNTEAVSAKKVPTIEDINISHEAEVQSKEAEESLDEAIKAVDQD